MTTVERDGADFLSPLHLPELPSFEETCLPSAIVFSWIQFSLPEFNEWEENFSYGEAGFGRLSRLIP